jgi:hypothetical protein
VNDDASVVWEVRFAGPDATPWRSALRTPDFGYAADLVWDGDAFVVAVVARSLTRHIGSICDLPCAVI